MQIKQQTQNDILILIINGRADSEGSPIMEQTLQAALDRQQHHLVLDLTHLDYINSAGLRVLVNAMTHCRQGQGDVHLVGVTEKIMRIFEIIGLHSFFKSYASIDEAVAAF